MLDSKCKTTRVLLCNIYLHVRTCTCIILYIHDCVETLHVCTGNVYTFKFMDKQFESANSLSSILVFLSSTGQRRKCGSSSLSIFYFECMVRLKHCHTTMI